MQVIKNHRRHFGGVAGREEKFPHVAIQKIVDEIEKSIDGEQPTKEEMPPATAGQPEVTRNRDPARKSARCRTGRRELNAKQPRRVEPVAQKFDVTTNVAVLIGRRNGDKRFLGFGFATPVKMGKGIKNLQPAHE